MTKRIIWRVKLVSLILASPLLIFAICLHDGWVANDFHRKKSWETFLWSVKTSFKLGRKLTHKDREERWK